MTASSFFIFVPALVGRLATGVLTQQQKTGQEDGGCILPESWQEGSTGQQHTYQLFERLHIDNDFAVTSFGTSVFQYILNVRRTTPATPPFALSPSRRRQLRPAPRVAGGDVRAAHQGQGDRAQGHRRLHRLRHGGLAALRHCAVRQDALVRAAARTPSPSHPRRPPHRPRPRPRAPGSMRSCFGFAWNLASSQPVDMPAFDAKLDKLPPHPTA